MIDKRLLDIKRYITDIETEYTLKGLSEYLNISERQLVRLFSAWQEEDLIEYIPGRGRGNKIEIIFKQDVEAIILNEVLAVLETAKFKEIQAYVNYSWNDNSAHVIQRKINQVLNQTNEIERSKFIEYVPQLPTEIHPAFLNDTIGAQISYQVFDALYRTTNKGEVKRNLLSFDEWIENTLHLHLKKDIKFSNGSNLTAKDVKHSLEQLIEDSLYRPIFSVIEAIEVINNHYLLLKFNKRPKYFEYTLSSRYSSIYKKLPSGELVGTGPYYIERFEPDEMVLKHNVYYRGNLADIETIYIHTKKEISEMRSGGIKGNEESTIKKVPIGNEFLLFNPHKTLTVTQRGFITDIFCHLLGQYIHPEDNVNHFYIPCDGQLPDKATAVKFNRPITVLANEKTEAFYKILKQLFATYEVELNIIVMSHIDYLNTHLLNTDVDFIWMYENYNQIQPFKTYDLLTQCKFQEWYSTINPGRSIMEDEAYMRHDAPATVANQYIRYLELKKLFVPLALNQREVEIPQSIKNIKTHSYGTLDYKHIVIDYSPTA
ncbi:ABC transporter substrate-binding protein [Macrococcus sp. DPC7161]|uniref:ABC transporter substrate-binding protein n=1 Tax=Macrococcus sp. DPC7161 TaxID=2507060 RepID=UPI00100B2957|nr:ABC transporter substrate-binding protein [Macrococcus sp. DPC7161]RXK17697.1 hypothetical protein ER639_09155 [Macrococcus sp. DPC7161]